MNLPRRLSRKLLVVFFALVVLGLAELALIVWKVDHPRTSKASDSKSAQTTSPKFDKQKYSINDMASPWAIVNKGRMLPADYIPANLVVPDVPLRSAVSSSEMLLRADAAAALETLYAAGNREGVRLRLASGYRSYSLQVSVYNSELKSYGQAGADRESARPGHSEHQTGLAADLEPYDRTCEVDPCFADKPEGKWLAANAYKYGFIIRYQKDKETLTGYKYEPWHIRYIGVDLATQVYKTGQTLEQFFSLPAVTAYPSNSYQLKLGA